MKQSRSRHCKRYQVATRHDTIDSRTSNCAAAVNTLERCIAICGNLVTNTIKFTPAGKTVTLTVSSDTEATTVTVADEGVSMTTDQLRDLFRIDVKRSLRSTAGEHGTGLGLVVCNELLARQGSRLQVESEQGKGSRFWFEIRGL